MRFFYFSIVLYSITELMFEEGTLCNTIYSLTK
jgi:hypothetical protein